ncbi:hypothetical protein D3C76_431790 [compost metagenome]
MDRVPSCAVPASILIFAVLFVPFPLPVGTHKLQPTGAASVTPVQVESRVVVVFSKLPLSIRFDAAADALASE